MQKPNAIIFDLDGVLTDTSEYHYQAWKRLADDLGIPFTREENDAHLRGVSRRESLMYIIRGRHYTEDQIQEMMDRKNSYYNEMIKKMTPNDLVPGGRELLQEIQQAGIKIAVASGSKNARTVLNLLDINNYLNGIADGSAVSNGKPAPDIFVFVCRCNAPLFYKSSISFRLYIYSTYSYSCLLNPVASIITVYDRPCKKDKMQVKILKQKQRRKKIMLKGNQAQKHSTRPR